MRTRILAVGMAALLLALAAADLAGVAGLLAFPRHDAFGPGVFVGPVDVSGLNEREAARRLERYLARAGKGALTLVVAGETVAVRPPESLGVNFEVARSVRDALLAERARRVSLLRRLWQSERHPLQWRVEEQVLLEGLQELAAAVFVPPQNALKDPRTGAVIPHQDGRELDLEQAERALLAWARNVAQGTKPPSALLELPVRPLAPHVDAERLSRLLAEVPDAGSVQLTGYATHFDVNQRGRSRNVALAARWINGYVLMPGEVFSFNEVVGPRTLSRGFLPAPEIVGEEFVEGVGGGICQVSSTLYNAALYADLEIVERYRHSVPLGYVPPGRDSTLQYGVMDFRFRNTTGEPLVVRAEVDEERGRLRVTLWGRHPLAHEVRLWSEVRPIPHGELVTPDPGLPQGEVVVDDPGKEGRWIYVFKERLDPSTGEVVSSQVVSRNHYPPEPKRVRIGTGEEREEPQLQGITGEESGENTGNGISSGEESGAPLDKEAPE